MVHFNFSSSSPCVLCLCWHSSRHWLPTPLGVDDSLSTLSLCRVDFVDFLPSTRRMLLVESRRSSHFSWSTGYLTAQGSRIVSTLFPFVWVPAVDYSGPLALDNLVLIPDMHPQTIATFDILFSDPVCRHLVQFIATRTHVSNS
jgi:hypothetical protein